MKKTIYSIFILFLAYFIPGKLGFFLALPPDGSTAVWPSSGFASAGVLLLGYSSLPGVFLGSLFLNLHHKLSIAEIFSYEVFNYTTKSSLIALGAMLESLTVAFIIKRFIGFPSYFSHWKDVVILFIVAGLIGSIPSPTIGVSTLYFMGYISSSNYLYNWVSWWTGNSLGIIAITPILVTIFSPIKYISRKRKVFVAVPLITVLILISVAFINTNKYEQRKLQQNLNQIAHNTIVKIQNAVDKNFSQINYTASFYDASNFVSRDEFNDFLKNSLKNFNWLYAIEWIPRVDEDNKETIINQALNDGILDFSFKKLSDNSESEVLFPILYSEPFSESNRKKLGTDIMTDPNIARSINKSIKTGDEVATEVREIQEQDNLLRVFTIYKPVYDRKTNNEQILGFISGTYIINKII